MFNFSKFIIQNGTFETKVFPANTPIFKEGAPPQGVYLILSGTVEVHKGGEKLRTLGPDHIFGELGLISGQPRQATVITQTPVKALIIPAIKFRELYQTNPELKEVVNRLMEEY